ncbi:MAG: pseudouridine synthase [Candidatus Cloacimonadaceae bacterium]
MKLIRLNKFLAEAGLASRRKADELILSNRITVNGEPVKELGTQINPFKDKVELDGKPVKSDEKKVYIILNKPRQYVVTRQDEFDRKTIYKLLPDFAQNCVSAGRLDKDSEGLLLVTNDGDVVQALTHPTKKVEKTYRVEIDHSLYKKQLEDLRRGVVIEGYKTRPAGVFVKSNKENNVVLKMVISEGKKRQIRYMIEAVGRKVLDLKRIQIGEIELGKLPTGMWRLCSRQEISYLMSLKQPRREK